MTELRFNTAAEIEELTKRYQGQIEEKAKYIEQVNADVSQKSLLLGKLEQDIIELKSILANKDEEIRNLIERTSGKQRACIIVIFLLLALLIFVLQNWRMLSRYRSKQRQTWRANFECLKAT